MTRVVAIVLVRNEDIFIDQALRNVLPACDEMLIADNLSTDHTPAILEAIRRDFPDKVTVRRVTDPSESHAMIAPLTGTDTWIFGVDGDEIYDGERLKGFFDQLRGGLYRDRWMILGNVLNVAEMGDDHKMATGYLAPPCRSMTKLYNFAAIDEWGDRCPERLHGGNVKFRPGYDSMKRVFLHDEVSWADAVFRCLHLCFLRRSSQDKADPGVRKNIMDNQVRNWRKLFKQVRDWYQKKSSACWKNEVYRRGEPVTLPVGEFFDRA